MNIDNSTNYVTLFFYSQELCSIIANIGIVKFIKTLLFCQDCKYVLSPSLSISIKQNKTKKLKLNFHFNTLLSGRSRLT